MTYEELHAAIEALSPEDREVYVYLDDLMDKLYDCGVDVSHFPAEARYALVLAAKELQLKKKESIT